MTEAEWLASDDPYAMWDWLSLSGAASINKARSLFAVLCERIRRAEAGRQLWRGRPTSVDFEDEDDFGPPVAVDTQAERILLDAAHAALRERWGTRAERVEILREIFGNPNRPGINTAWLTPQVVTLARAADRAKSSPPEEIDPLCLAVLSDALEEAGCTDADILAHLRSPGPHFRGCWALDLILGKG
jgi:hypothetical protein